MKKLLNTLLAMGVWVLAVPALAQDKVKVASSSGTWATPACSAT